MHQFEKKHNTCCKQMQWNLNKKPKNIYSLKDKDEITVSNSINQFNYIKIPRVSVPSLAHLSGLSAKWTQC